MTKQKLKHLGIIMDGNRRWAESQGLESHLWHKEWAKNAIEVIKLAKEFEIEYLTLWWLSTENLQKRSKKEVFELLRIISDSTSYLAEITKNNWKIVLIWDIEKLPRTARKPLEYLVEKTKNNTWITIILALVYGWKDEIIRGIKKFISSWDDVDSLDEKSFFKYLDTGNYPPADLIIRTGWDLRHSGFLLYGSDYSEYYFSKKKWPDFNKDELKKALASFYWSKRNFWK